MHWTDRLMRRPAINTPGDAHELTFTEGTANIQRRSSQPKLSFKGGEINRVREEERIMNNKADLLRRITIEPGKCGGRPCLRGTRMQVVDVLELLSAGADQAEILRNYPSLELDDILACLEYAARQTNHVVLKSA